MSTNPTPRWLMLAAFLLATFAAAGIGGYATAESVNTWYPTLIKPSWNPPAWIFGPVWTVLYILMSVAAWRVWLHRDHPATNRALALFFVQLSLNALWSVLFFGLQNPSLALIDVIILWTLLFAIWRRFRAIDSIAGWLWLPYLLWVSFATVLNAAIVWLNR